MLRVVVESLDPLALAHLLDVTADGRRALIVALEPTVTSAVTRVLTRARRAARRPLREEVEDVSQEVFVELFSDDVRVLRQWDPARGRDLRAFVRLIAERFAIGWTRSASRRGALEDPLGDVCAEPPDHAPTAERVVGAGEVLQQLLERLRRDLTPKGWMVFHELFLEEREIGAASQRLAMQPSALWAWRSRISSRSRMLAMDLVA